MIKKTFKTIFKSKTLLLFLGIMFALSIISKTAQSLMNELLYSSSSFASNVFIYIQLTQLYGFFDSLLQGIFISAPILYCVLLVSKDNLHKGWYRQGLKRNWWRYLVIWVVLYFIGRVTNYVINMVSIQYMSGGEQSIGRITLVFQGVNLLFGFIKYLVIAPVIAEDSFADGLRNTLIVGRRYFFRLFFMCLLSMIPMFLLPPNPSILFMMPVLSVASSLTWALVTVFMHVYTMNLNLSEKEKLEPTAKQMLGSEK